MDVEAVAKKLGRIQKQTILSLSEDWGRAYSHAAAKRLWYSQQRPLVLHAHRTDNCWALTPLGLAVRDYLERQ